MPSKRRGGDTEEVPNKPVKQVNEEIYEEVKEEINDEVNEEVNEEVKEEVNEEVNEEVTDKPAKEANDEVSEEKKQESSSTENQTETDTNDDSIDNMNHELVTLVKKLEEVLADHTLSPEQKMDQIKSLQDRLDQVGSEAKMIEEGLEEDIKEGIKDNVAQPAAKQIGGSEQVSNDDITLQEKKLNDIQKTALVNIVKADVKMVLEYANKTNDARALKALFQYQNGKDAEKDILSVHVKNIQEIIDDPTTDKPTKNNAEKVLKELKIARIKLYSLNIETLIQKIENQESDVNFFPDELKTELSAEQKRITSAILAVFGIVKYVIKQFGKAPTPVVVFTLLSLLVLIIAAYLAFKYSISIVLDYANNKLINNPTNSESLDFIVGNFGNGLPRTVSDGAKQGKMSAAMIKVTANPIAAFFVDMGKKTFGPLFTNLMTAKYKYALFVILPWISILFAVIALVIMIKRRNIMELTPGIVQVVLYACVVQSFVALIMNNIMFYYAFRVLKATSFRIDSYNKYVMANMSQRADFLAVIQKMPTNAISIASVSTDALATLFAKGRTPSAKDLSKAMFTLNLFEHYQQLGFRNPVLYDALESFRIYSFVLSKQNFSPALYLRRRSTLIRDNSEKYRNIIDKIMQKSNRTIDPNVVDNAIIQSSKMTAEANNLANSFFPEDAMSRFLQMAVVIAFVQFMPLLIFVHLFRKKDLRDGFIEAIRVIFGQKKKMENADLYDQEAQISDLREMVKAKKNEKDNVGVATL